MGASKRRRMNRGMTWWYWSFATEVDEEAMVGGGQTCARPDARDSLASGLQIKIMNLNFILLGAPERQVKNLVGQNVVQLYNSFHFMRKKLECQL